MRSVSEMYGPRSRSFTYSTRISRDAGFDQLVDRRDRQDLVGLGEDLAGLGVEHVVREDLADQVFLRHFQARDAGFCSSWRTWRAVMRRPSSTMTFVADADRRSVAVSPRRRCGISVELDLALRQVIGVLVEEHVEHLLVGVAERAQDDRDRELAAPVDAREHAVLRIELEVEPRAAVRNDARGEQQLARSCASCRGRDRRTRPGCGAAARR